MANHSEQLRKAFARALKTVRKERGITQEDFALVSSRTYLSTLERALKSPTLEKIDALAGIMKVHPLTLLTLCYQQMGVSGGGESIDELLERVQVEVRDLGL
jgi:transcriptional regulator with XRE-family HTH domain